MEVTKAWKRLRHRNAHPDWMDSIDRTDDGNRQAIEDMMLLAQFYGSMMLALAGAPSLQPPPVSRFG